MNDKLLASMKNCVSMHVNADDKFDYLKCGAADAFEGFDNLAPLVFQRENNILNSSEYNDLIVALLGRDFVLSRSQLARLKSMRGDELHAVVFG